MEKLGKTSIFLIFSLLFLAGVFFVFQARDTEAFTLEDGETCDADVSEMQLLSTSYCPTDSELAAGGIPSASDCRGTKPLGGCFSGPGGTLGDVECNVNNGGTKACVWVCVCPLGDCQWTRGVVCKTAQCNAQGNHCG